MLLDFTLLYFFIPVFFVISITPGLCMTLALTMGITIGVKNTMKMMVGELIGGLLMLAFDFDGMDNLLKAAPIIEQANCEEEEAEAVDAGHHTVEGGEPR